MGLAHEHDLHRRRFSRNVGVGLALGGFAALVFALTMAKISDGEPTEAFDHALSLEQLQAAE